jgi:hypothetical protein
MANKTAAPWEIPYPEAADEIKVYPTLAKELAERVAKLLGEHVLTYKAHAASYEAKSGELGELTKTGQTVTLPLAATANQIIGIWMGTSGSVKITTSGGVNIFGDFITGQATIELTAYQHVILQSNGAGWLILAGEPKRTETYSAAKTFTKAEAEAGVEPSAARPAFVLLEGVGAAGSTVTVGGVNLKTMPKESRLSFIVPPGQKWTAAIEVVENHLLL